MPADPPAPPRTPGKAPPLVLALVHVAGLGVLAGAALVVMARDDGTRWFGVGVLVAVGVLLVGYLGFVLANRIERAGPDASPSVARARAGSPPHAEAEDPPTPIPGARGDENRATGPTARSAANECPDLADRPDAPTRKASRAIR